ncbi:MAG: DNA repair protein RecN [Lachnospiraceae bacterium]|nr:DNA repair protein RecN [Lachnospiraceae bacterium]
MLRNLHIKNLALIREIDIDFAEGLNILTGETGAGKSIIIDSVNLALGGRAVRSLVRDDADYGLVELLFEVDDAETISSLREMDVDPEDGVILISRKMKGTRSIFRINGETRPHGDVRECASLLLDIHGQSEHQKLLGSEHQLSLLDAYGRDEISLARERVAAEYSIYSALKKKLESEEMSEEERNRQKSFLEFEVNEISSAGLVPGEDEQLEKTYKKLANSKKIVEAVGSAHDLTGYDSQDSAGDSIGRAIRCLEGVSSYDSDVEELLTMLSSVDDLLNDFNRSLSDYLEGLEFADEAFAETETRLDLINHLKSKYGRTVDDILAVLEEKKEQLTAIENYEEERAALYRKYAASEKKLETASAELTALRKKTAEAFSEGVRKQLSDLNFARADFEIRFNEPGAYSANGRDRIDFMIATNPGEERRILKNVVSGGELSRIMLGIKTMFAAGDRTGTLIFDEVDTGISGRTAQKVAEKMAVISRGRQVLCITHLPQIAAMADTHYGITKDVSGGSAVTRIEVLDDRESEEELARLLGGAEITQNTQKNAREMKEMCRHYKKSVL